MNTTRFYHVKGILWILQFQESTVLMLSLSDHFNVLKIHGPIYTIHDLWDVE